MSRVLSTSRPCIPKNGTFGNIKRNWTIGLISGIIIRGPGQKRVFSPFFGVISRCLGQVWPEMGGYRALACVRGRIILGKPNFDFAGAVKIREDSFL